MPPNETYGYRNSPLLAAKIKPGDLVGLRLPHPAVRLIVTTGGEDGDLNHRNGPWYTAVEHLCTDLITKFPQRSDCAVLQQVKQRPDETVADFLYRMEEVFNKQSGMEHPANFTVLGPWKRMLCGYVMEGLLPEIAAQTKTLYVGWRHGVLFEELKRHALHSDDVINNRKKTKVDKRETDLHNAALTVYYSINQRGSSTRGPGRCRRGRGVVSLPQIGGRQMSHMCLCLLLKMLSKDIVPLLLPVIVQCNCCHIHIYF
ncbi:hypothetical protein XENOCAPTIV_022861 [Xenoophorus captivus]|uniref:Retrotransposon gag domain-containing protein n=1 Tax=Xenoophorus captivus TaxID=1517983 RepID=A0ABV0QC40_9TELE